VVFLIAIIIIGDGIFFPPKFHLLRQVWYYHKLSRNVQLHPACFSSISNNFDVQCSMSVNCFYFKKVIMFFPVHSSSSTICLWFMLVKVVSSIRVFIQSDSQKQSQGMVRLVIIVLDSVSR